jgi:hypothetical protein
MDALPTLFAQLDSKDVLINIANLFLLASFSVKSMLWLRSLNIVAGTFFIWWALSFTEPLWASIAWNVLFGVINVWRIWLAILERRPPHLSHEEQRLYHTAFSSLHPRAYRKLLDLGQWENGLPPNLLVASGQTPNRIWMVAEGRIEVRRDGAVIRQITVGDFLGEASFLANKPMGVDAFISEPIRCLSWTSNDLDSFIQNYPDIGAIVQRLLGRCLVRKLEQRSAG